MEHDSKSNSATYEIKSLLIYYLNERWAMRFNVLLIIMTIVGMIGVEEVVGNDSGAARGSHELHKNCVQCHGDQPEQTSKNLPNLVASVPKLCYGCHKEYLPLDGWVHGPVATGDCLFCHDPHERKNKSMLSKPIPELCRQCHEAGMLQFVDNHSKKSYVQCNNCHNGHISLGRMLLKHDFLKTDAGADYIRDNPSNHPLFAFAGHRSSVGELNGVRVIAELKQSDLLKRYGLTKDALKTKIEMQLRRNGIRIIDEKERNAQQSCLCVDLRLTEVPSQHKSGLVDALSGSLNLFFRQKMELPDSAGNSKKRFGMATTWDSSRIIVWKKTQIKEGLDESIKILIEKFGKEYLDTNAKN
jgi:predicted CXXCH cytochrome family protein